MRGVVGVLCGVLCLSGLCLTVHGCSRGDEGAAPGGSTGGQASTAAGELADGQTVAIAFRSDPDPPSSGDNTVEVIVTQPDGSPVTDATVEVVFSMPAMPSMNMPAMRSAATLQHQAAGRYRGTGELSMSGTWNVIVTVSRGTEELSRRTFSVIAK